MMCQAPLLLDSGQLVACRKCWQCKQNRIQDWVGRCIAESKVSVKTFVVTLTYGRDDRYVSDHAHSQILTYSDVQGYLKRLRYHSGPVRFFAAGEYGSAKGRAHWHLILFYGTEKLSPDIRLEQRYMHHGGGKRSIWPHGWSYWENASHQAIQYACKYILKDWGPGAQAAKGLSTRPPLGALYFDGLAAQYVNNGLSPQNTAYYFAECKQRNGELIRYLLTDAPAYGFLQSFDRLWQIKHGARNWPQSDLLDVYVDEAERRLRRATGTAAENEYWFIGRFELERREKRWHRGGSVSDVALEMSIANQYNRASRGEASTSEPPRGSSRG